jgi:hypothetical protein
MIDRDLVELLVALALIVACAVAAIATASPRRRERAEHEERAPRRKRGRRSVMPASRSEALAPESRVAIAAPPDTPVRRARPRILTGEPAAPEPHEPATRRAIKLVGGVTALAAGGAVGLLVLVRALVAMFKRING